MMADTKYDDVIVGGGPARNVAVGAETPVAFNGFIQAHVTILL